MRGTGRDGSGSGGGGTSSNSSAAGDLFSALIFGALLLRLVSLVAFVGILPALSLMRVRVFWRENCWTR
jgi:hypothetical protein